MTKTRLKISSQFQITLPKSARNALALNRTDALMLEIIEGVLCLRRAERPEESGARTQGAALPDWRYAAKPIDGASRKGFLGELGESGE
jgi:AbrB family looped-hinge helix DNA binding protein